MNVLSGHVESVNVVGALSLVRVKVGSILLTSVVVDTPTDNKHLAPGAEVNVIFKETEVILGLGPCNNISLRNKLPGKIGQIDHGELLCRVTIRTEVGEIVSIITANAVQQLDLATDTIVTAMIKTNEMMLSA